MILLSFTAVVQGQQMAQYSQYIWNSYLVNPAIGGAENFIEWKAGYRNQWVGIEGAPVTMYLTMHGQIGKKLMNREDNDVINRTLHAKPPSKFATALGFKKRKFPTAPTSFKVKPHHGVGGQVISDQIGPFTTFGVYGSYSYHIPITREVYISLGTFIGLKQYKVDPAKITLKDENDKVLSNNLQGLAPDGMIGAMAYGNKFYLGASIGQMFNNRFNFKDEVHFSITQGALKRHFFVVGGYRIKISENVALVPSSMLRIYPNTPVALDVTAKLNYLDMFWIGASMRANDAMILLAGFSYKNRLHFGYSYDLTTSELTKFSSGSHEVIVGYRLINKPTKGCKPSYVW